MIEEFMRIAIAEAKNAEVYDEVPVGAVIVKDGIVIASAGNMKERENCAIYHAEIVAITKACKVLDNWYLDGCDMYVTLEPCAMCSGAIINSRLDSVYYGASDMKTGCAGSVCNLLENTSFNHQPKVIGGVLADECGGLLSTYFKGKRAIKKANKLQKKMDI